MDKENCFPSSGESTDLPLKSQQTNALSQQTHQTRRAKLSLKRPAANRVSSVHESSESYTMKVATKQRRESPTRAIPSASISEANCARPTIVKAVEPEKHGLIAALGQKAPSSFINISTTGDEQNLLSMVSSNDEPDIEFYARPNLSSVESLHAGSDIFSGAREDTGTSPVAVAPSSRLDSSPCMRNLPDAIAESSVEPTSPLRRSLQSKSEDYKTTKEVCMQEEQIRSEHFPENSEYRQNTQHVATLVDQSSPRCVDDKVVDVLSTTDTDLSTLRHRSESNIQSSTQHQSITSPSRTDESLAAQQLLCKSDAAILPIIERDACATSYQANGIRAPFIEPENGDDDANDDDDFEGPSIRHRSSRLKKSKAGSQSICRLSCKSVAFSELPITGASRSRGQPRARQSAKRLASTLYDNKRELNPKPEVYADAERNLDGTERAERNSRLAVLEADLKDIDRHLSKLRRRRETVQKDIDHIRADNHAEDILPISAPGPEPERAISQLFGSEALSLECENGALHESLSSSATRESQAMIESSSDALNRAAENSASCDQNSKLWSMAANVDEYWVDMASPSLCAVSSSLPGDDSLGKDGKISSESLEPESIKHTANHLKCEDLLTHACTVNAESDTEAPPRSCGTLEQSSQRTKDDLGENTTSRNRVVPLIGPLGDLKKYWIDRVPDGMSLHFPNWRENLNFGLTQGSNEIDSAIHSMRERRHALSDNLVVNNDSHISAITFFIEAFTAALKVKRDISSSSSVAETNFEPQTSCESKDTAHSNDIIISPSLSVDVGSSGEVSIIDNVYNIGLCDDVGLGARCTRTISSNETMAEPSDDTDLCAHSAATITRNASSVRCETTRSDAAVVDLAQRKDNSCELESQKNTAPTHEKQELQSVDGDDEIEDLYINNDDANLTGFTATDLCPLVDVDLGKYSDATLSDSEILDLTQREDDLCQSESDELDETVATSNTGESCPSVDDTTGPYSSRFLVVPECGNSQTPSYCSDEAAEAICEFVQSHPELYERVLMFESLDPGLLQTELRDSAHLELSLQTISTVLRKQGISVSEVD